VTEFTDLSIPLGEGHYVYRAWADDACVYVGSTSGWLLRRIYEHKMGRGGSQSARMKVIFEQVTRVDFAEFIDREAAGREEDAQIRRYQPAGNKHLRPWRKQHYRPKVQPSTQGSLL